ncbi:hypothetical protein DFA_11449 [Cavenderia fasciculata]|uniref:Uncharacterized protein n=1 Tax=Cavenderia fasciculata TaxID=261658 RepID=F4QD07_CACFS|nr:uncharacterized protein DFA_11449 [Cavenderia fasciculata]EGG13688.1 hypothetical protein DFA_11449 [Cavenderia fasciculata]|eukprot:XP_004350392.1 hypothetical protein DFA_11449 [Cavenderia fasciculata]
MQPCSDRDLTIPIKGGTPTYASIEHQQLQDDLNVFAAKNESLVDENKKLKDEVVVLEKRISANTNLNTNAVSKLNNDINKLKNDITSLKRDLQSEITTNNILNGTVLEHRNLATSYKEHKVEMAAIQRSLEEKKERINLSRENEEKIVYQIAKINEYIEILDNHQKKSGQQTATQFISNNHNETILNTKRFPIDRLGDAWNTFIMQVVANFLDLPHHGLRAKAIFVSKVFEGCFGICQDMIYGPINQLGERFQFSNESRMKLESMLLDIVAELDPKTTIPYQKARYYYRQANEETFLGPLIDGCCDLAWKILLCQPSVLVPAGDTTVDFDSSQHQTFPGSPDNGCIDFFVLPPTLSTKSNTPITKALVFLKQQVPEETKNHHVSHVEPTNHIDQSTNHIDQSTHHTDAHLESTNQNPLSTTIDTKDQLKNENTGSSIIKSRVVKQLSPNTMMEEYSYVQEPKKQSKNQNNGRKKE